MPRKTHEIVLHRRLERIHASMRPRPMPRKTRRASLVVYPSDAPCFNEAAAHAAENQSAHRGGEQ